MSERDWNEYITRKKYIDKLLIESQWGPVVQYEENKRYKHASIEEYPTETGPADYALFHNKKPFSIVEGKKVIVGVQNVLQQAQRYSRGFKDSPFAFHEFKVPFIYSTNGKIIWFQDLRHPVNRSREVKRFHTPDALEEFLSRNEDAAKTWLKNTPIDNPYLRNYQKEAIGSIERAILERKRNMLIAMATGTGKTFTIINLIYRLMKSGYGKRILFLVDRRALAAQAVTALASFEAEPGLKFDKIYEVYSQRFRREDLDEDMKFDPKVLPTEYLTNPQAKHSFVYVSTIQRMRINLFGNAGMFGRATGDMEEEEGAEKLDIPIHAFDVIIADECHRGYTAQEESKWREALMHFDGIRVGLTATPAAHTTAFFKEVVYRYDYERAVKEGFLVDYDAVAINSDITINGVFLKQGEEIGLKDTSTGQLVFDILEDERELEPATNESEWTAPDRNKKIVKEIKKYLLDQEEQLGHFPKTLIFANNDIEHISHCDQLVNILRDEFNRGDSFVQKITGSSTVDRPLQRIREFRNRQNPGIVVTVDMLSTGVDIPKVENIIFLRPVKSRILFEQMMGRGTRLCEEINKTHFTVFDCFRGTLLEYFRKTTAITAEAPIKPTRIIKEVVQAIADNQDRAYNISVLSKRLQRISKNITQESRSQFNYILGDVDIAEFAKNLGERLDKDWAGTMRVLQSEGFFSMCDNYQRPLKKQIVAEGAEDIVSSEIVFRATDGNKLRPEDYLKLFEKFVRENPEHIQALEILINKPKDFHVRELKELRLKLSTKPDDLVDKFKEQNLRRAYNKELADIVSIIRHAAKGEELITAESRIDRALAKVKASHNFSEAQEKWLGLIRRHLIANLLIERDDIDSLPIFTREGLNYRKLNKIFNGELDEILQEINEAVLI
ncbi:MAG: DEAD/DEAH box helicase family protein [Candidatus Omnitrophota bacterium]|nr:MAG: DEAD/DEAH box helicase family protein [Candidatus Omnitrophota bacterium]